MAKKKQSSGAKQTSMRVPTTANDVKSAVLVVSLLINLAVLIFWIFLRLTTQYDEEVFDFLFTR